MIDWLLSTRLFNWFFGSMHGRDERVLPKQARYNPPLTHARPMPAALPRRQAHVPPRPVPAPAPLLTVRDDDSPAVAAAMLLMDSAYRGLSERSVAGMDSMAATLEPSICRAPEPDTFSSGGDGDYGGGGASGSWDSSSSSTSSD